MEHSVVIALKDQHFEPAGSIVESVASGDELAGLPPGNADPVSGDWLDELADGLSEHGWMTLDVASALGLPLLASLASEVSLLDRSDAMKKAGIGRGTDLTRDRSVRRDRIAWLQGITAPQAALFDFFETIRAGLNQRLFLGLKRFEAHYATYQAGDFYKKHLDGFQGEHHELSVWCCTLMQVGGQRRAVNCRCSTGKTITRSARRLYPKQVGSPYF